MSAEPTPDAPRPSILLVEGVTRLGRLREELVARYGADYAIHATSSATAAHHVLDGMASAAAPLALVLTAADLEEATGTDVLLRTRARHPLARRVVLIDFGEERASPAHLTEAAALGHMHHYAPRPRRHGDERFHRAVTELLEEWWRLRGDDEGPVAHVIADDPSVRAHRICDLLTRHDIPHRLHGRDSAAGRAQLAAAGLESTERPDAPVVVLPDGTVLVDPTNRDAGRAFGARIDPSRDEYDLAIVGGGPAGLAAAVHAASEGLTTVVVEHEALGGQAGTSSLIRNYLGFPRGIAGSELAARAPEQAKILGAEVIYGTEAVALRSVDDRTVITRADGSSVRARAVVIASGVAYERIGVPAVEAFVGHGVFYGAAVSEARSLTGRHVFVVGGGNSAGQAALHLAAHARHVTMLVRSGSLATSMSQYLITEVAATPNIRVRYGTEVVGADGEDRLSSLALRAADGSVTAEPADALVVLIGGRPRTGWLPDAVARDRWGYVLTGEAASPTATSPYETSVPGVFAVGDVRQGSIKRVTAAVGEGTAAIPAVHAHLARQAARRPDGERRDGTFASAAVARTRETLHR